MNMHSVVSSGTVKQYFKADCQYVVSIRSTRNIICINCSCPVDSSTLEAIWTPKSFEADPDHVANPPVAGNIWYQVAGPILAARWNKLNAGVVERKIFFKCTVLFCTVPDEFDNCVDVSIF